MKWKEHNVYFKWKVAKSNNKFRFKPRLTTHSMGVKNFSYHKEDVYSADTFGVCYFFHVTWLWWTLAVDLRKLIGCVGKTYWKEVK